MGGPVNRKSQLKNSDEITTLKTSSTRYNSDIATISSLSQSGLQNIITQGNPTNINVSNTSTTLTTDICKNCIFVVQPTTESPTYTPYTFILPSGSDLATDISNPVFGFSFILAYPPVPNNCSMQITLGSDCIFEVDKSSSKIVSDQFKLYTVSFYKIDGMIDETTYKYLVRIS